jgi:hypothetical protein
MSLEVVNPNRVLVKTHDRLSLWDTESGSLLRTLDLNEFDRLGLLYGDVDRVTFTAGTDQHASRPEASATAVKEKILPIDWRLRRAKSLNNVIEQARVHSSAGRVSRRIPSVLCEPRSAR